MLKHSVFCRILLSVFVISAPLHAEMRLSNGFVCEKLHTVDAKQHGSWVSMTVDPQGRLYVSDQYGGLCRITLDGMKVEKLPVKLGGAHGLLWHGGKLYASVAESKVVPQGLYIIEDRDGDGMFDTARCVKKFQGGGEHGPHGIVASPDGQWIYVVCGNHTKVPEGINNYHNTPRWGEDHLLPSQPDARGHARHCRAPGGWVARFKPDGSGWELFSQGYRNAYDIAFNEHGELFAYDADMEWDLGTPWYRPTRLCHVTSGSEFGWRTGTAKWPSYYPDSLPSVIDLGPGSPTGLLSGKGLKFPGRYQRALFAFDWTFATIYAIHLKQQGAGYVATKEEFLSSEGMPLSDAVVGTDGAMYFLTGGRRTASALYRIRYVGEESVDPIKPSAVNDVAKLRKSLDALHLSPKLADTPIIFKNLGHEDRAVRYSARVALENMPWTLWKDRVTTHRQTLIQHSIATARQGDVAGAARAMERLLKVNFSDCSEGEKLGYLRAVSLLMARHGVKQCHAALTKKLDPFYPSNKRNLDRELCRVLSHLQSSTVVEKTLRLMAVEGEEIAPDWAQIAQRNQRYGKDVLAMLRNMPSTQKLHYAYCLRVVKGPWTEGQRRQYFEWFQKASQKSGGMSYKGFLTNLRKQALEYATDEERKMVASWKLVPTKTPIKNLPKAKGPGRNWTVDEVVQVIANEQQPDLALGKKMFHATLCSQCHQVNGEGGGSGPDLSRLAARFKARDIADAIIHPNKVVSDQYQFSLITKKDGSSLTGRVIDEKDAIYIIAPNPFDLSQTVEIPEGEIKKISKSPVSPMPPALINTLNAKELASLMAWLKSLK